ncbi:hypothetical protein P3G55_17580 [Leptospira sp. 96542]|nr:hypothetical protein [Leptospira sp. 96542]
MTLLSIDNLELGAGCGKFGKIFFNPCILTDNDQKIQSYCSESEIDVFCEAEHTPFDPKQFKLILICNPYNYGFLNLDQSILLMTEINRILKNRGKIIVITHESNIYANYDAISTRVPVFQRILGIKLNVYSKEYDPKDFPGHKFYICKNVRETKPNQYIEIEMEE